VQVLQVFGLLPSSEQAVAINDTAIHVRSEHSPSQLPLLMTVDDVAELLRTTNRAIYAMVERRQLPGLVRIGRRVLFRSSELLHWLNQKSAPSHRSDKR
jgi:excisionase family DNA binding protein